MLEYTMGCRSVTSQGIFPENDNKYPGCALFLGHARSEWIMEKMMVESERCLLSQFFGCTPQSWAQHIIQGVIQELQHKKADFTRSTSSDVGYQEQEDGIVAETLEGRTCPLPMELAPPAMRAGIHTPLPPPLPSDRCLFGKEFAGDAFGFLGYRKGAVASLRLAKIGQPFDGAGKGSSDSEIESDVSDWDAENVVSLQQELQNWEQEFESLATAKVKDTVKRKAVSSKVDWDARYMVNKVRGVSWVNGHGQAATQKRRNDRKCAMQSAALCKKAEEEGRTVRVSKNLGRRKEGGYDPKRVHAWHTCYTLNKKMQGTKMLVHKEVHRTRDKMVGFCDKHMKENLAKNSAVTIAHVKAGGIPRFRMNASVFCTFNP